MSARLALAAFSAALALFVALPAATFIYSTFSSVAGTLETISKESSNEDR